MLLRLFSLLLEFVGQEEQADDNNAEQQSRERFNKSSSPFGRFYHLVKPLVHDCQIALLRRRVKKRFALEQPKGNPCLALAEPADKLEFVFV